jgi:hypothetical protein
VQKLREVTKSVDVPGSTGVDGFLHAIREIIKKPRVQRVVLEANGRVTYIRLVEEDDEEEELNLGVNFSHLEPYNVIRNVETRELSYPPALGAADVLTSMFDAVSQNGFTPICFATGVNTIAYNWFYFTSGIELQNQDQLFGYPIYSDKQLPDTALVLCAGLGQTRALIDTRIAVKVEMQQNNVLRDDMEIL